MADGENSWAIVAIPSEGDHIWKVSSEKVPHMTLLFLGEQSDPALAESISIFLQHLAESTLTRFGMSVDRRGTLGPDNADVLFFKKLYEYKKAAEARSFMLKYDDIFKAYNSTPQYPEWTPHLTLGYPETPAHEDDREFPISWVNFDKIALWTGDYEGSEFLLPESKDFAMSDLDKVLAHYGVKGMKWGIRRSREELARAQSSDYKETAAIRSKAKATRTSSLSNAELKTAINRMQLERQYNQLSGEQANRGAKFVRKMLGQVAQQQVTMVVNENATKVRKALQD